MMTALKKFWWIFGLCAEAATLISLGVTPVTFSMLLILVLNIVIAAATRIRRKFISSNLPQGGVLDRYRSSVQQVEKYTGFPFWLATLFNIILLALNIFLAYFFTFCFNPVPDFVITPQRTASEELFFAVTFGLFVLFACICVLLAILRLHDIRWDKKTKE